MERKEIIKLVRNEAKKMGCNHYKKQLTTVINNINVQRAVTILEQKEKLLPSVKNKLISIIAEAKNDFWSGTISQLNAYDCDLNKLYRWATVCYAAEEATHDRYNYIVVGFSGDNAILKRNEETPVTYADTKELKDVYLIVKWKSAQSSTFV